MNIYRLSSTRIAVGGRGAFWCFFAVAGGGTDARNTAGGFFRWLIQT